MPDLLATTAYDWAFSIIVVLAAVLLVWALVAWFRAPRNDATHFLAFLVIVLIPVLGPIAYLSASRSARRRQQPHGRERENVTRASA